MTLRDQLYSIYIPFHILFLSMLKNEYIMSYLSATENVAIALPDTSDNSMQCKVYHETNT